MESWLIDKFTNIPVSDQLEIPLNGSRAGYEPRSVSKVYLIYVKFALDSWDRICHIIPPITTENLMYLKVL